jgi:Cd2+/Zn2+-exporting ATPase
MCIRDRDCPDCARGLERTLAALPGVVSADLSFAGGTLLVEYEPAEDPRPAVVRAIGASGHSAEPLAGAATEKRAFAPQTWWIEHRTLVAMWGSGVGAALAVATEWAAHVGGGAGAAGGATAAAPAIPGAVGVAASVIAVLFGWILLAPRAWSSLSTRTLDINALMLIAITGAFAAGDHAEAASVVFLYVLGMWLEARALARTRSSIRDLMELAPATARRVIGDVERVVPLDSVAVGTLVRVRPGERVPLDGVVAEGVSAVNEAAITGEPIPAEKTPGSRVFAGSLNTSGLLDVEVTAAAGDSTLARVVELVEQAQAAKAPVQQLVDRFSAWYTPSVVVVALAIAIFPPLVGLGGFAAWAGRALVLLVVACPCALVISTPVSLVSAISRAGRDGVLVKGGAYLEAAARVRAIAFDKTGTLTAGRPALTVVEPLADGISAHQILALTVGIERHSNHPVARAIVAAYDASESESAGTAGAGVVGEPAVAHHPAVPGLAPTDIEELPGQGISGRIGGAHIRILNPSFAEEASALRPRHAEKIAEHQAAGRTVLVVLRDAEVLGLLGVEDPLRAEAADVVSALREGGIEHTAMLTGDHEATAAAIASRVGLSAHMSSLLPADKVEAVLRVRERFGVVAMVGDGVNDAPALAAADVGVAMGAAGSDTALVTADVALMADSLSALPGFFELARRTLAAIRANVIFAVGAKLAVLVAAALGYASMWLAVFADTGVALIVIANGMRLLVKRGE